MHLPHRTRPSALLQMIELLESGVDQNALSTQIDLVRAKRLVRIMDVLRMRKLERHALLKVIMPQISRDSVLEFLNLAHSRVLAKKRQYKVEYV